MDIKVGEELEQALLNAMKSGEWLITVTYVDKSRKLQHIYEKKNFPDDDIGNTVNETGQMILNDFEMSPIVDKNILLWQ